MRSRFSASLAVVLSLLALPLAAQAQSQFQGQGDFRAQPFERQALDRIVAVVNQGAIMASELDARLAQVRSQLAGRGIQAPSDQELRAQVLERMIVEELQLQRAEEANLSVDDTELNRAVRSVAESNGMSLEQFADALEADGLSLALVREDIRRELLTRELIQRQVANRITISEREVERFLAQQGEAGDARYRLGHILVALPRSPSSQQVQQAQQRVRQLSEELAAGADFGALAAAHSDGGQALEGGDLGWRTAGELPTLFVDLVPTLAVGEVSEPLRSPSGFHLVKLVDRQGGQAMPAEAQRQQAQERLFQRKVNEEIETWLQELRSQAFVDIRL
ncbi:peptidylprolyl isomerase [Halomonas salifodinae]|uniref:peptidylprolyl isomerase n=1 Tax=Halomonas salifodinae TaxID=438745 RepID=UPI0033A1A664